MGQIGRAVVRGFEFVEPARQLPPTIKQPPPRFFQRRSCPLIQQIGRQRRLQGVDGRRRLMMHPLEPQKRLFERGQTPGFDQRFPGHVEQAVEIFRADPQGAVPLARLFGQEPFRRGRRLYFGRNFRHGGHNHRRWRRFRLARHGRGGQCGGKALCIGLPDILVEILALPLPGQRREQVHAAEQQVDLGRSQTQLPPLRQNENILHRMGHRHRRMNTHNPRRALQRMGRPHAAFQHVALSRVLFQRQQGVGQGLGLLLGLDPEQIAQRER